jgi:hypothetical protein
MHENGEASNGGTLAQRLTKMDLCIIVFDHRRNEGTFELYTDTIENK